MVYMPAGRKVWQDVSEKLNDKSISPKIWLGDPVHDEYARENYKDCIVLDFYKLNKIIGTERLFFSCAPDLLENKFFYVLKDQVYKMMDRQDDFGVFGRLEREALFYSLFFYFYTIVLEQEIDLLVASEAPHSPASMILYGVCKILNIKTYHLAQNSIVPVAHICTDFYGGNIKVEHDLCFLEQHKIIFDYIDSIDSISEVIPEPHYMQLQSDFDEKTKSLGFKLKKYFIKPVKSFIFNRNKEHGYSIYHRDFFNQNIRPFFYEKIISSRKRDLFSGYSSVLSNVDLTKEFVFVPLHYEPERTSNPDGGDFYNAYDMILWLRSFLPSHIFIVIKEHSSQFTSKMYGYRGRSPLFYKAVNSLHNVFFVDIQKKSSELIGKSIFIATQTGSAALEAALMQKKSLVFGAPWFLGVPNIYSYKDVDCFYRFYEKELFNKNDIKNSLISYVEGYAIPACVNPSGEKYFMKKFGDLFSVLVDDDVFSKAFTDTVYKDYMSNRNAEK